MLSQEVCTAHLVAPAHSMLKCSEQRGRLLQDIYSLDSPAISPLHSTSPERQSSGIIEFFEYLLYDMNLCILFDEKLMITVLDKYRVRSN